MAEEFQGGVCGGGSWWNSSRNLFASSPCSSAINDFISWPPNQDLFMDINTTTTTTTLSNDDSAGSNSDNGNMTPFDWTQELVGGRSEEKYSHILQESAPHVLDPSMNYRHQACPQIKDWTSNNFCDNNNNNSFKQVNHQDFPMESAPLFNYSSLPLLQSLFEDDPQPPQSMTNSLQGMNYSSGPSYPMINSNDFAKPSAKQQPADHLRFTNDTQFWNSKAADLNSFQTSLPLATQLQFVPSSGNNAKPNLSNFVAKRLNEETGSIACVAKKASSETPFKRPRIETPSPLPTFKVRKEKLGDRITALQQLVSPFGKTDTASVLHEAIEYIKFLHDQVNVLSTPYMKNGSPPLQHQQAIDKLNDHEGLKQDLRSRGLCLVPISSTFPVASETTSDFWTPTFGGSFR